MSDAFTAALIGILGTLGGLFLLLLLFSGFNLARLGRGLTALNQALRGETPPAPELPKPPKPSAAPVRFLALLQREGRLVDFLTENIQAYDDAQIGAAVREIHRQCQAALQEHLDLEPVMAQEEGAAVEVPAGFDLSAVRLLGNVTGQPPFRGTLVHRGWRVKQIKLAPPPEGQDEFILQPAEVQLP